MNFNTAFVNRYWIIIVRNDKLLIIIVKRNSYFTLIQSILTDFLSIKLR